MRRLSLTCLVAVGALCVASAEDILSHVDPFTGTSGTGHTFPAACVPFGSVQAGPDTGTGDWGHCSGYRFEDKRILGFSQNHLSGTGCSDLGDILVLPFVGEDAVSANGGEKSDEMAKPGRYGVTFADWGIRAEATATAHVGLYQFAFSGEGTPKVLVDTQWGHVWTTNHIATHVISADVRLVPPNRVEGTMRTVNWCDRTWAFSLEFEKPWSACRKLAVRAATEKAPRYVFEFAPADAQKLGVKVAISTVDVDGARKNLAAETRDSSFADVCARAEELWREMLSRAEVTQGSDFQKKNFYTALYHLFTQPVDIADVDGRYRGADGKVAVAVGGHYYSTLSTWDTFRAAHPLYTLLAPERVDGFIQTMLAQAKATGCLPVWALQGKETWCMIGTHSIPVIADAWLKGFRGFDPQEALAAMKASTTGVHKGRGKENWDLFDRYGYYPFDHVKSEGVSRALEDAYDASCAARFATAIGNKDDAAFFAKRAGAWRNVYDASVGFMRGKDTKGNWRVPFDPYMTGHENDWPADFTEGNSWQYTWHVMQDPDGLMAIMGGKEKFADRLEGLFRAKTEVEGSHKVLDISGLIGQYAHGNEPSHHVVYFFTLAGRPRRTAELVRQVFDTFYAPGPEGLCGNDDCGQMSAWYIFSALGFYPFDPCGGEYVLGAPQIPEVRLRLANGKAFVVRRLEAGPKDVYVASAKLNGAPLTGTAVSHRDIVKGGTLEFAMEPARK